MDIPSIITLLGGLAVFLYGMKLMSESLQSVAGDSLKSILGKITTNRFAGVLSGLWITTFIQSSSATTVMVVSFVNAGLLSLKQSIGMIMGANIGTTVTAWIVAILGFKFKISSFALPAIVIGLLFTFRKKDGSVGWGNTLIGFGLLFLGLSFMKSAIPDAAKNPEAFAFLSGWADFGILSVIIFIGIGTILTIIIQSSSATTTLTLTLAFTGNIPIHGALAMILGENIGTTITAFIASFAGNAESKKAALAHTLFNVFGVVWAVALFYPFIEFIDFIVPGDMLSDKESTRFHISAFHTAFNIINTGILIWFTSYFEKIVNFLAQHIIPGGKQIINEKKMPNISDFLTAGPVRTPEASILALEQQNAKVIKRALKGLKKMEYLISEKYDIKNIEALLEEEEDLDISRSQTAHYLSHVQERGVSGHVGLKILEIMERTKTIEEISDNMARVGKKIRNANKVKISLTEKHRENLLKQLKYIKQQKKLLKRNITNLTDPVIKKSSRELYDKCHFLFTQYDKKVYSKKKTDIKQLDMLSLVLFLDISRLLDMISKQLHKIIILEDFE
ncbi:MAG: Na/Pi symporter [Spirochaetia bacterium]|nr:Na/Pi symporter [Spirochaetia bacterium]